MSANKRGLRIIETNNTRRKPEMGNWDELSIKTDFMKGILSKVINKVLKKKSGCDIAVQVNELSMDDKNKKVHVHLSVDAEMSMGDLEKLLNHIV